MIPSLTFKISDYEAEEIACEIAGLDFYGRVSCYVEVQLVIK